MTLPGGPELIIILFIVLLFFGAKKLPGLAGSLGTSMREFRKATQKDDDDVVETNHNDPNHSDPNDPPTPRES